MYCMFICRFVHMSVQVHTCTEVVVLSCLYMSMWVWPHECVGICTSSFMCVCSCQYMCLFSFYICMCICMYLHMNLYMCAYAFVYASFWLCMSADTVHFGQCLCACCVSVHLYKGVHMHMHVCMLYTVMWVWAHVCRSNVWVDEYEHMQVC